MKKWMTYSILMIIILLGMYLRNYNLTVWPREGATFDEFAWVFQGLSIWEKGVPTSWSPHAAYSNRVEYKNPQGARFTLVTPYLEHPPLFGLIAGGFARLNGVVSFDKVTIPKIRPLALFMGVVSILSVYLFSSAVFGAYIGLISALFYSVVPTVVAGSRIVQNENFFIPCFLLSLYFAYRYCEWGLKRDLYPAVFISGIIPLAKIPWIAAPLAIIGMFLYKKKFHEVLLVLGMTIVFLSLYVGYGLYLDRVLLIKLWNLQLARYDMSFNSFFAIFQNPMVTDRIFVDGWLYAGWASVLFLMIKDLKKTYPVVFGFLGYLCIYLAAIPNEPGHGWYRYPFYPFLLISLALLTYENFIKNRLVTFSGLTGIGLSLLEYTWKPVFGFSYVILRGYIVLCALTTIPLVVKNKNIERYANKLSWVLGIVLVMLSCWAAINYNEQ